MPSSATLRSWSLLLASLLFAIVALHILFDDALRSLFASALESLQSQTLIAALAVTALASDVILPIPSSVISVACVLALGFVGGFFTIWVGLCLSCLFAHWIGRRSRGWIIQYFFRAEELGRAQHLAERWGGLALVLLRAVPVMAEASVVVAGMANMPLAKFIRITALANAGIALIYASVAAYAGLEASFVLAFAASVALPLLALGMYKVALIRGDTGKLQEVAKLQERKESHVETLMPTFNVQFSFPLCFTSSAFSLENPCLAQQLKSTLSKPVQALFFVDQGVLDARATLHQEIEAYCHTFSINHFDRVHSVAGGDAAKTQEQIDTMYQQMLDVALDRQSYVVAIGGGAVLDAVGYAAATFHRGIRLVRMPTTVLAQNDAGVGVKNGINAKGFKNLYGSFAVPTAIVNDSEFLKTLSQRDFRSGFAEAIKVGLIRDGKFFHWICSVVNELNRRDAVATHQLIKRCAELHLNQICNGGDPFEMGSARPLDYGHWSAHKLESLTQHELAHGEAVAIGMALDALYAVEVNLLSLQEAETVIELISSLGFNVWHPALQWETAEGESALLRGLEEFRQHLGGELCITLLTGIGKTVEVSHIDTAALLRARDKLIRYENPRSASVSSELLHKHSSR